MALGGRKTGSSTFSDTPRLSPSQGLIEMGWDGAVLNEGVEVKLDGYDRYDNPWSQSGLPGDDVSFFYGDALR